MDSETSKRITSLNFLMTCCIVLSHIGTPDSALAVTNLDVTLNYLIGGMVDIFMRLAMTFFFCLTGFRLFYKMTFANCFQKVKRRCFSLFVPYLLWQILYLAVLFVSGTGFNTSQVLKEIFLFADYPPNVPLWYLYVVFLLALFSPILLVLFKNKKIAPISLAAILTVICWMTITDTPVLSQLMNYGYVGYLFSYLPAYFIGAWYGSQYDTADHKEILTQSVVVVLWAMLLNGLFQNMWTEVLKNMFPIAMIHGFPLCFYEKIKGISKISFVIYAVHLPFLELTVRYIRPTVCKLSPYVFINNAGTRLIGLLLSILVSWIVYQALKTACPKLLKVLTGGRVS